MELQGLVDAWNARDAGAIAARFAPDGVRHHFAHPEAVLTGRAAITEGVGAILGAVPDAALEVRDASTGPDGGVTLEWTFTGTLQNELMGLPGNGAAVTLRGVSVCALTADGLIAEERVYWDGVTLMVAAGVIG